MSHSDDIRKALDSIPYTAPERMNPLMVRIMRSVDALVKEHGWKPYSLYVKLPEGVTHEQAQAAVDALTPEDKP